MNGERAIRCQIDVPANLSQVWNAWTTEAGAQSFFAPECRIDLKPGGAYEMLFNLEAKPGHQGGEGMVVLAFQPENMISFTWNAPPDLSTVRGHMTHVVVRFLEHADGSTRVHLRHDGWGNGGEWNEAFTYFSIAWADVVLPRLKYRFAVGPIDWENPPDLTERAEILEGGGGV